jgi:hypothetical protein
VILPNRFCEIDAFERLEDVVVSLLHVATAEGGNFLPVFSVL